MKKITIKGMHCDACKKLITMELEDLGLDQYIDRFELEEDDVGTLYLVDDVSESDIQGIKECIEEMEGYSVV